MQLDAQLILNLPYHLHSIYGPEVLELLGAAAAKEPERLHHDSYAIKNTLGSIS